MNVKITKTDLVFVALISILAILHYCAWSDYPTDADPINFTVALRHFAPEFDAPHPPGYPLFVFSARLVSFFVGEYHAYQFINLLMLLGTGAVIYSIFRRKNESMIGITSAILLMTHPLALAATVVPECYISDVFFGSVILASMLALRDSHKILLIASFIIFFLLGMIRPVSCFMLLPMAMVAGYSTKQFKAQSIILALVATIGIIAAYGITVYISGGLSIYRAAAIRVIGSSFHSTSVFGGAPLSHHLKMLSHLFVWLFLLASPMVLLLLFVSWKNLRALNIKNSSSALMIGVAWLFPPLVFYSCIYYLKPTYQLIYIPCLLIPIAWMLFGKQSDFGKKSANLIFSGLVMFQLGIFFIPIPHMPQAFYRQTEAYVIQQDHAWTQLNLKLETFRKKDILIIWVSHPSLHLYAMRLLNLKNPIAVANYNQTELNYLDMSTMKWLEKNRTSTIISEKYIGVVIINELAGKSVLQYIDISNPLHHRVDYLLKPVFPLADLSQRFDRLGGFKYQAQQ